jgi:hypothetical protein
MQIGVSPKKDPAAVAAPVVTSISRIGGLYAWPRRYTTDARLLEAVMRTARTGAYAIRTVQENVGEAKRRAGGAHCSCARWSFPLAAAPRTPATIAGNTAGTFGGSNRRPAM